MVLEQFIIDADIIWDQVGKTFFENPEAKPGRIMRVQVVNAGIIEDLTGYTLNLGWTSVRDPSKFGLDAFDDVDITKGIFEIEYTSGMLTNIGPLNASLQLVPPGEGRPIESNNFKLTVKNSAINASSIQGETSFSTLENALVEVNGWNARIDVVEQEFKDRADALDEAYPVRLTAAEQSVAAVEAQVDLLNRGLGETMSSLALLNSTYPTGDTKDHIVAGNITEVDTLTVTTIPTIAGNITVTLNGVSKTIAVDPAVQTTTALVASLIRGTVFAGWTTSGTGSVIAFTATATGARTAPVFAGGTTGVTAAFAITVKGENANFHRYFWNGSAWADGGIYQAIELTNDSVTPDKTSFLEKKYINFFDKLKVTEASEINPTTGLLAYNAGVCTSDFMSVTEGEYFSVTSYFRSGYYRADDSFVQSVSSLKPVPTGLNIAKVRFTFLNANKDSAMFVKGSTLPATYVPSSEYTIELGDERFKTFLQKEELQIPITPELTTFFESTHTNLIDKSKISRGYYINDSGVLAGNPSADTSDLLPVRNGAIYATPPRYINESTDVWSSYGYTDTGVPIGRLAATNKQIAIEPSGGIKEVTKLVITGAATSDGNITINLDGVATTVSILTTDTLTGIADKIRATAFSGWVTSGTSTTIYFTADVVGKKAVAPTFGAGTTGTVATITRAQGIGNTLKYIRLVWMKSAYTMTDMDSMLVEGTDYPVEYVPYSDNEVDFLTDDDALLFAKKVSPYIRTDNELYGLTWGVLGDSITADANAYHKWVGEALGLNVINYGIGETSITYRAGRSDSMSERYVNMSDDCDIVTVLGGTNDNSVAIGTMADRTNVTFYGALHVLYAGLKEKFPGKRLGIMLMTPRDGVVGNPTSHFALRINAELEVAHYYGYPVLDLFNESGIAINIPSQRALFIPDGLHPSIDGHKLLARPIIPFLKRL